MLHMGASVYVLDGASPPTTSTAPRFDRLDQRQREGAAVIQRGPRVEEVARLCQTVLWFDEGDVRLKFRAPPEVAVEAEERKEDAAPDERPVLAPCPIGVKIFPDRLRRIVDHSTCCARTASSR